MSLADVLTALAAAVAVLSVVCSVFFVAMEQGVPAVVVFIGLAFLLIFVGVAYAGIIISRKP